MVQQLNNEFTTRFYKPNDPYYYEVVKPLERKLMRLLLIRILRLKLMICYLSIHMI